MDRRQFMKLCAAAVAGVGIVGVPVAATKAATMAPTMAPAGFIAGGQIRAGQLVGVGPDGLCYPMDVEKMARMMAKAIQVPWELIDQDRKGSETSAANMN